MALLTDVDEIKEENNFFKTLRKLGRFCIPGEDDERDEDKEDEYGVVGDDLVYDEVDNLHENGSNGVDGDKCEGSSQESEVVNYSTLIGVILLVFGCLLIVLYHYNTSDMQDILKVGWVKAVTISSYDPPPYILYIASGIIMLTVHVFTFYWFVSRKGQGEDKDKIQNISKTKRMIPGESTFKWKYPEIFIQVGKETKCHGFEPKESLPLGVPIDFESKSFKGKILFRVAGVHSDDPDSDQSYFQATKYNIQRQIIFQGKFKQPFKMSQVFFGTILDKSKMNIQLPSFLLRWMQYIFNRLSPGILLDVTSDDNPKVLSLLTSACHTISIDEPGCEPDITSSQVLFHENTHISHNIETSKQRKTILSKPLTASKFQFDTEHVYTFHIFDEFINLRTFQVELPLMKIDLNRLIGDKQPLSVGAVTKTSGEYDNLFHFRFWHR